MAVVSLCRAWALGVWASAVVVQGLKLPHSMWGLSGLGIKLVPLHWQVNSSFLVNTFHLFVYF